MIRLVQRKLIIPRGDTGSFSIPAIAAASNSDVAIFTIFDCRTHSKVFEKSVAPTGEIITFEFTHNDTVNLPAGNYTWDIKFYRNPVYADNELVNGEEIDSYYAGYTLPTCEIRETGDNFLMNSDSPAATLTPEQLDIISAAIAETQSNVEHYPYVGENNRWYVWDATTNAFVNTGVRATGRGLDTGGEAGQILKKASSSDYDTEWADETDPTVPAWAKAAEKPTYTAAEVGALPNDTFIPSNTSDLINDSNFAVDANYVHTDNNYTTEEKNKLSGIAAGAEVNVNADWNAASGDAQILNKPTIPTKISDLIDDSGHYTKPAGGIPAADLAETYLTQHQDISGKQDVLTFDNTPTALSNNPVTSSGIKSYVDGEIARINTMKIHICTAQEYNAETGIPTIINPEEDTFYLVPGGESNNLYIEWVYVNNAWERFGSADIDLNGYVLSNDIPIEYGTGTGAVQTKSFTYNYANYTSSASNLGAFAEGSGTASGIFAHAEGSLSTASGNFSHAEGQHTRATGRWTHSEGYNTEAIAEKAHSEGSDTSASGEASHAEGYFNFASGPYSHAEGVGTYAIGYGSHAEGKDTHAVGKASHVSGINNVSDSYTSWQEWVASTSYEVGDKVKITTIKNNETIVVGYICKIANNDVEFTAAHWTVDAYMNYVEIIGNGTDLSSSNARALSWDGNEYLAGDLYVHTNNDSSGGTKVAKITDIPTIPTNVSTFTNDAGYLTSHQDISGKADKVNSAVEGNFAALDANGNLTDSGHKHSDYLTEHQSLTGKQDKVTASGILKGDGNGGISAAVAGTDYLISHQDISGKADKVTSATNGNFAALDSNGNLTDSGHKHSDYAGANVIVISDTQPTNADNKIWIEETIPSSVQIPTVSEMNTALAGKVGDVQVNGTSIVSDGVANVPIANGNTLGVIKTYANVGLVIGNSGLITVASATTEQCKAGTSIYQPIVPSNQDGATFYGLAKAAGDTTQSQSDNAVGVYTDTAKGAIQSMLDVPSQSAIADKESTTATSAHSAGDLFLINGKLYKALSAITIGETITTTGVNPNAEETNIVSEIPSGTSGGSSTPAVDPTFTKIAEITTANEQLEVLCNTDLNGNSFSLKEIIVILEMEIASGGGNAAIVINKTSGNTTNDDASLIIPTIFSTSAKQYGTANCEIRGGRFFGNCTYTNSSYWYMNVPVASSKNARGAIECAAIQSIRIVSMNGHKFGDGSKIIIYGR